MTLRAQCSRGETWGKRSFVAPSKWQRCTFKRHPRLFPKQRFEQQPKRTLSASHSRHFHGCIQKHKKIFISFDLRFRLSFFYNFFKPFLWLPQETELKSNWRNFFYDLRLGERNERLIYMIASRPLLRSTLTYETVFLLYVPFASMSLLTHFNLLINFLPCI